jgi:hypothetical protein
MHYISTICKLIEKLRKIQIRIEDILVGSRQHGQRVERKCPLAAYMAHELQPNTARTTFVLDSKNWKSHEEAEKVEVQAIQKRNSLFAASGVPSPSRAETFHLNQNLRPVPQPGLLGFHWWQETGS